MVGKLELLMMTHTSSPVV